jgi:transposase
MKKFSLENKILKKYSGQLNFVESITKDLVEDLEKFFPECFKEIFTISFLRVIEDTPLNEIEDDYEDNSISNKYTGLSLSPASISKLLHSLGQQRENMINFMNSRIKDSKTILFDGTSIFSNSKKIDEVGIGYNHHGLFKEQYGIMFGYSLDKEEVVYYRIFDGSMKDQSIMKDILKDLPLGKICIIADKGFGSQTIFESLKESKTPYIIPLKRNTAEVPQ